MLSPLLVQQDPLFFDILMSDPKALATLSEELYSCVTDVATTPTSTVSPAFSSPFSLECTTASDCRYSTAEAPPRPDFELPLVGFTFRPERPASTSSGGRDIESAESEASTTPTPTWDELLNPRVLGRDESAAYRRQRAKVREHRRLAQQREAFEKLQEALPGNTSRMSRLDLLRLAIRHIQDLHRSLSDDAQTDSLSTTSVSSEGSHSLN